MSQTCAKRSKAINPNMHDGSKGSICEGILYKKSGSCEAWKLPWPVLMSRVMICRLATGKGNTMSYYCKHGRVYAMSLREWVTTCPINESIDGEVSHQYWHGLSNVLGTRPERDMHKIQPANEQAAPESASTPRARRETLANTARSPQTAALCIVPPKRPFWLPDHALTCCSHILSVRRPWSGRFPFKEISWSILAWMTGKKPEKSQASSPLCHTPALHLRGLRDPVINNFKG